MSGARRSPWHTLHGVTTRAIGRLERTLATRRAALAEAEEAASQRAAAVAVAGDALADHAARLDALLAGAAGVSPQRYLEYDAWRGQLAARWAAAGAALGAAQQNVLDKRDDIRQTRQEIAAATARRDDLARRLADEARFADAAQQDAQDEEAAEAALARRGAGRAEATA
ncbi:hypothetical protein ACFQ1A_26015 [Massilia pinisoli]|uniref:hypothetical protein n=1 Tax=Massilia pinisoli TaxID=1772194 RepID=UPI00363B0EFC